MEKQLNYDYDFENDNLYFYTNKKYKDSIEFFGFIIDITTDEDIKGIEILNASEVLSDLSQETIPKTMLKKIIYPTMNIKTINDLMIIKFDFKTNSKEFSLPLNITNPQKTIA